MLPKITTLRQAKAIVDRATKYSVAGFDEHNNVTFNGDRHDHLYARKCENGEWIITHYVYGRCYGNGASAKEALMDFINKNPDIKKHVLELKAWRKKATAIVAKHSKK